MPSIEINGKKVEAKPGSMIIEVTDGCHIHIPRFCYHKKLSIAANCRMCLVEVEKSAKPLPACATPVTEGMKVWTRSPKALLAQKAVMEFLLINHPLDCPICDQGGECELQDLALGYGSDLSRYTEGKRVVKDKNIGPLISTDMTRCIQCTRCVRFGTEVAGVRELGATGRGECMEIGTFIERSVESEVSGNIIDLCPVGALTSKPFRFAARGWELQQGVSIAPHDCVGSNLFVHTRRNQVMRVVPKENELINEVWISDRDRYSYEGLYHEDRLKHPKIKRDGIWQSVSWQEALEFTAKSLGAVRSKQGAHALGALVSPNATLEECYLLQKFMRGMGSDNIDHRLRQSDFRHQAHMPLFPNLGVSIKELEQQSVVLLIGSAIRKEQPILGLKLRKMTLAGGKALVINPVDFEFNFEVAAKRIVSGGDLVLGLARVAKAIFEENLPQNLEWLSDVIPEDSDKEIAKLLLAGEKKLILLGMLASSHPAYSQLIGLARAIAQITGAKLGLLTESANSAGAWLAGAVPHRLAGGKLTGPQGGLTATEMLEQKLKAYILFNLEPELDTVNGEKTMQALRTAECVVAMTSFESEALQSVATVMLPLAPFTETAGTLVNAEGQWQSFQAVATPLEGSRPGWKILRVLGNVCDVEGFEYETTSQILELIHAETQDKTRLTWGEWPQDPLEYLVPKEGKLIRIAPVPLYATDGLVRRAKALQQTEDAGSASLRLNDSLVKRLNLTENRANVLSNGEFLTLPYVIDERVPDNSILIDAGIRETMVLGEPYRALEIKAI